MISTRESATGREGNAFGQHAAFHQLLALIGAAITGGLLYLCKGQSAWLTVPLGLVLGFCGLWFIGPGHGLVYGPHLWLMALIEGIKDYFKGAKAGGKGRHDD